MAIREKKKIKTNKLTGKNIITTVIYNDEYADGFGGRVKKLILIIQKINMQDKIE